MEAVVIEPDTALWILSNTKIKPNGAKRKN